MKMKHALIAFTVAVLLVPASTAVVDYDGPEDQPHIMGGESSASATTSVGPNGTEWRSEVSMVNKTPNVTEDRLENIQYGEENYTVEFDGFITAGTPCHVIDHEVSETDDGYVMNVETSYDQTDVEGNQSEQMCAQVQTMIEYDGSFSADEDFTLEVRHDNETVGTLDHPGMEKPEEKGLFGSFLDWFAGLFRTGSPDSSGK